MADGCDLRLCNRVNTNARQRRNQTTGGTAAARDSSNDGGPIAIVRSGQSVTMECGPEPSLFERNTVLSQKGTDRLPIDRMR